MVKVSGFTMVRNAVKLDFPLEASIRSILPICDEMVVAVGKSEDDTLDLVRAIDDPKIRIVETEWDFSLKSRVLSAQTQLAMRACRYPWGVYIQADEVLHERGAAALQAAIQRYDADPRVEGLLVKYVHFYGDLKTIATSRRWYRREVRAVRLDPVLDVRSFRDAQGFRVGPNDRKIRARLVDAEMFHYGWARPTPAIRAKREASSVIWDRARDPDQPVLTWIPCLRPFRGTHPAIAREWIEDRLYAERQLTPRRLKFSDLRFYISAAIERVTGARVFEFRNYELLR